MQILPSDDPAAILTAILHVTKKTIIPLVRENVAEGGASFAAAILTKSDLAPVAVAVNKHQEWPLLHGETNCIREFFKLPSTERPRPTSCIFFATHEPCSLCLSGIAWTKFPLVYYLFTYEDTREMLGIGGDIDILEEIFRVRAPCDTEETLAARPLYNKENKYFRVKSLVELLEEVTDTREKESLKDEIQRVKVLYAQFTTA